MGQVITQRRPEGKPGPGTRGAAEREAARQAEEQGGGATRWWLLLIVLAVAISIAVGWALRSADSTAVVSAADEAQVLQDEKERASVVAAAAVTPSSLHDEKTMIVSRAATPASTSAERPLSEQQEKELVVG